MSRLQNLLMFLLALVMCPSGVTAANGIIPPKPISPSHHPTDYDLQGEYFGSITYGYQWQDIGLQVIARGDGAFEAVLYEGGLPGNGWSYGPKLYFESQREKDSVLFRGATYFIVVEPDYALIYSAGGKPLGQIAKTQRQSPAMGIPAPPHAGYLFWGTDTKNFARASMNRKGWLLPGAVTKKAFGDFTLHLEFRVPYQPRSRRQGRGNSGIYLQNRYEVQILDSFGLEPEDNGCGALYRYRAPDINMSFPPLVWQTYDIKFTAPRFDSSGYKLSNARVTVWHNGVAIHRNVLVTDKTGNGRPEGPDPLPTVFQDHGDPVRFRNVWIVEHVTPNSIGSGLADTFGDRRVASLSPHWERSVVRPHQVGWRR